MFHFCDLDMQRRKNTFTLYIARVAKNYLTLGKITFILVVVWRPLEEQQLIGGVRLYRWWFCSTHLPREDIHIIQVET